MPPADGERDWEAAPNTHTNLTDHLSGRVQHRRRLLVWRRCLHRGFRRIPRVRDPRYAAPAAICVPDIAREKIMHTTTPTNATTTTNQRGHVRAIRGANGGTTRRVALSCSVCGAGCGPWGARGSYSNPLPTSHAHALLLRGRGREPPRAARMLQHAALTDPTPGQPSTRPVAEAAGCGMWGAGWFTAGNAGGVPLLQPRRRNRAGTPAAPPRATANGGFAAGFGGLCAGAGGGCSGPHSAWGWVRMVGTLHGIGAERPREPRPAPAASRVPSLLLPSLDISMLTPPSERHPCQGPFHTRYPGSDHVLVRPRRPLQRLRRALRPPRVGGERGAGGREEGMGFHLGLGSSHPSLLPIGRYGGGGGSSYGGGGYGGGGYGGGGGGGYGGWVWGRRLSDLSSHLPGRGVKLALFLISLPSSLLVLRFAGATAEAATGRCLGGLVGSGSDHNHSNPLV